MKVRLTHSNTKLSGAVIASTDNQGNDTGKLNLTIDTYYNYQRGIDGANFTNHSQLNVLIKKGEASILDRINLLNAIKLATPSSKHSGYDPYKFEELKDVMGYKK